MENKKIVRACLIGCGRAGMIHARNYKNKIENASIVALVDPVEAAVKAAAEELGVTKCFTDYTQMLNDPDIDAVIVVAPTDLHKQIVVDCAAAGKHIFCEKPMAMTVEECDEMIEACDKYGVKLQVGFMRRFDASFREAKRLVAEGAIGELVQIHSNTRGPSKPRPWMYDIKKSNGILAEVNSHDIDAVRWMADSDIDTVYAVAGNFRNPEAREQFPDYYDSVLMSGTMKNGIHFCIGSALARAEGRITVETMLDRTRDIRISAEHHGPPDARRYRFVPTYMLRGLAELHLELTPWDQRS